MGALPNALPNTERPRLRVLVVDDSVVLRSLLSRIIGEDSSLEVVGVARNGKDALAKVPRLRPDVITLDIEMPELDGIATLRRLQADFPRIKVVMCSSLTERGAKATVEALIAGASDYVTKRAGADHTLESLGEDLRRKILNLFPKSEVLPAPPLLPPAQPVLLPRRTAVQRFPGQAPRILAIGVSTGGPAALARVIPSLPADFPLPVVIVQHMPPFFTRTLAGRLAESSAVPVTEAAHGMPLLPGSVYIAPGDYHMEVVGQGGNSVLHLNQEERENSCRPAVDVLFRSVAKVYGGASIGMILTGMGRDGMLGAREMKAKGACILAQDAASSVVWGMPGAIVQANLANAVVALDDMMQEVLRLL